jgi:hypothetical protein
MSVIVKKYLICLFCYVSICCLSSIIKRLASNLGVATKIKVLIDPKKEWGLKII